MKYYEAQVFVIIEQIFQHFHQLEPRSKFLMTFNPHISVYGDQKYRRFFNWFPVKWALSVCPLNKHDKTFMLLEHIPPKWWDLMSVNVVSFICTVCLTNLSSLMLSSELRLSFQFFKKIFSLVHTHWWFLVLQVQYSHVHLSACKADSAITN